MNVLNPRSCYTEADKPKRRYATKAEAKLRIRKGQTIYHCTNCNHYHICKKRNAL